MQKPLIVIGIIVLAGIGYWLISPLFIDKEVNESIEELMEDNSAVRPKELSSGTFVGLAGHNAGGTARLIKTEDSYYVRFEDDFSVTNGPDLFVYLGKDGQYDPSARLAELKGNIGSQNYEIPGSIAVSDYNEVWVWCRAFSVAFGKAVLN